MDHNKQWGIPITAINETRGVSFFTIKNLMPYFCSS